MFKSILHNSYSSDIMICLYQALYTTKMISAICKHDKSRYKKQGVNACDRSYQVNINYYADALNEG